MTDPQPEHPEADVLPPENGGALSVPPPVPQKKPGFLRRLFMSRKKQQAVAMQNGYLEMVDLIRAIRSHLDRQESVQTSVLAMLEKVPGAMDRQHEVMTMFKQQLESGMENNRRLTESMGNLNNTLASMDESQRASSRTITDLIGRSRESEQLLREVMRRAERRMTLLLIIFFLLVVGLGLYFARGPFRTGRAPVRAPQPVAAAVAPAKAQPMESVPPAETAPKAQKPAGAEKSAAVKPPAEVKVPKKESTPVVVDKQADQPAAEKAGAAEPSEKQKKPEPAPAPDAAQETSAAPATGKSVAVEPAAAAKVAETPAKPLKKDKAPFHLKAKPQAKGGTDKPPVSEAAPAVGQPDLTLEQLQQATGQSIPAAPEFVPPAEKPVSMP